MQWPPKIHGKRRKGRVANRLMCQTFQQILGKQGRDLSTRHLAWQQVGGTVCPQTDEPMTVAHLKPPFLIRQAFLQSHFGCFVSKKVMIMS